MPEVEKICSAAARLHEDLVNAADSHGRESDPDMEVGDLQQALLITLKYVPAVRLKNLRRELAEILEWSNL